MSDYLSSSFGLKGKVAVVIGAGGYLCREMARGLLNCGVKVVLVDKDQAKLNEVAEEFKKIGPQAIEIAADVTKKGDHQQILNQAVAEFSVVDILINGAGINAPTAFFDISLEEWQAILNSHITATFLACQVFGKHMVQRQEGSIINISSASAGPPLSKAFTYSVAKAGVKNLTQNLAREWATSNVRVNALRPGFFPTQWSRDNFITPEREKAILGHTAMKRYGKPKELVGAVLWLASQAASFVTGAEIAVDGGYSCMTI